MLKFLFVLYFGCKDKPARDIGKHPDSPSLSIRLSHTATPRWPIRTGRCDLFPEIDGAATMRSMVAAPSISGLLPPARTSTRQLPGSRRWQPGPAWRRGHPGRGRRPGRALTDTLTIGKA